MRRETDGIAEEGYNKLPGNIRLNTEYRNQLGHSHVDAGPIHPAIDNQLGDAPLILDEVKKKGEHFVSW